MEAAQSPPPESRRISIGVIGGTGPHGRGLARRFALGNHHVLIGSRDAARATMVSGRLRFALPAGCESVIEGAENAHVAAAADLVILAVPWEPRMAVLRDLVGPLTGKVVVSCINPLGFDRLGAYRLPNEFGSAAEQAASMLPGARVVAAFHHLAAPTLLDPRGDLTGEDMLVCGDDRAAKAVVRDLCVVITRRRGIDAGPLRLARYIEPFTSVLISVNRRYRTQSGLVLSHVDPDT